SPSLHGKIALVTGASRGIGKGIALQLGQAGELVLVAAYNITTHLTAETNHKKCMIVQILLFSEVEERGGKAVRVYCDHSDSEEVKQLFERIEAETGGQLDILVNNAYGGVVDVNFSDGKRFYELDPVMWDNINNVGLRNHYYCTVYASRMMVKRKAGIIVHVSSIGGLKYAFNVPYGAGKASLDRMAADMAVELKDTGITIVSLWPAFVKTEAGQILMESGKKQEALKTSKETLEASMRTGESTEYSGKCIVHLATDPKVNNKSGKILLTSDIARHYGFKDIDGSVPMDMRSLSVALKFVGWEKLACVIPSCFKVPLTALHFAGYKFE
ncbi:hypothetical protein PENTCL1PPCAC_14374, partial [Pristionchus entomophagus]